MTGKRLAATLGLEHYDREWLWGERYESPVQLARVSQTADLVPDQGVSVLEVGAGSGLVSIELEKRGKRVVALDFALAAIRGSNLTAVLGNVTMLPFGDRTFDCVVAAEVIEHLPAPTRAEAVLDACRVTNRWLVVTVPYREVRENQFVCCGSCGCTFHVWRHVESFDEQKLRSIAPAGFSCERLTVFGPEVRYPPRPLIALSHLFQGYAVPESGTAVCPMCGNSEAFRHRQSVFNRALLGVPRRLVRARRGSWLGAVFVRRGA